ncbi:MAG: phosphatase PAP2 family protein [Candidatus Magasanikbacteria bacterium]|nr:phosphatase PAP2 family protein [Candidatus Magasanikbacteria bacterium]
MKHSWSHRLFLAINAYVGRYPAFDKAMIFGARWGIAVLLLFVIIFGFVFVSIGEVYLGVAFLLQLSFISFFGLVISWAIGSLSPHRRPIIEMPSIRQLITPFGTWKSFPSDHTMLSFIFVLVFIFTFSVQWYIVLALFMWAIFVSFSRVFVGVHYPRDLVGGFILALVCSLFFHSLFFGTLHTLFISFLIG